MFAPQRQHLADLVSVCSMMPLPWLTRCTGTCRTAASLMTACIAAGPSQDGISIRYCPPSSNRLLDSGNSCASRDGKFSLDPKVAGKKKKKKKRGGKKKKKKRK
jgi:hypothetical protein